MPDISVGRIVFFVRTSSYLELVDQDGDRIQLVVLSTALHVLSEVICVGREEDDMLGVFEQIETDSSPKLEGCEWSLLPRRNSESGFRQGGSRPARQEVERELDSKIMELM